jgi:hypothetical protein
VGSSDGTPQDRRVVVLIGLLVAAVLLASLVSALLPGVDAALASAPIIVTALVAGTVLVMARVLRG